MDQSGHHSYRRLYYYNIIVYSLTIIVYYIKVFYTNVDQFILC